MSIFLEHVTKTRKTRIMVLSEIQQHEEENLECIRDMVENAEFYGVQMSLLCKEYYARHYKADEYNAEQKAIIEKYFENEGESEMLEPGM